MNKKKDSLPVITGHQQQPLSDLQEQFNHSIERIKALKKKIEALKAVTNTYFTRFESEIFPLEDQIIAERVSFVETLDKAYQGRYFRPIEKLAIQDIIQHEAFNLINDYGLDELIELHDRHSPESYQEIIENSEAVNQAFAQTFIEEMFGVDLDEMGNLDDPENMARLEEEVQKKIKERERVYQEKRKRNENQELIEEQLREEAQKLSKTSRAIYTSLVKALHPDGELDENEKLRKTELMKKVTEAYQNNDFFALLKLQIEYTQGNTNIENLQDDQLKYYNKVLTNQVRDLQEDVFMFAYPPPPLNQVFFDMDVSQTTLKDQFRMGVLKFEQELEEIKSNRHYIQNNHNLRKFLREYIRQQNEASDDQHSWNDLDDLDWLFIKD